MSTLKRLIAMTCLLLASTSPRPVIAQTCGENEVEAAIWTMTEEGEDLYEVTFTGREATIACFRLLKQQYERRETKELLPGVPAWMGATGPLNLVTTWDTEYLPFAMSFLNFESEIPITRTVRNPVTSADLTEWIAGTRKTAPADEFYANDPTYTLQKADDEEIVYVWPDPVKDESPVFIEKRYRRLGGFRIGLAITIYNVSDKDVTSQPQLFIHSWEAERKSRSMFAPAPNILEGLCLVGDDELEREDASSLLEEPLNPPGEARWIATGDRYFLKGLINRGLSDARCSLGAMHNGVVSVSIYRSNPFTVGPAKDAMCAPFWYRPTEDLPRCEEIAKALDIDLATLFIPAKSERIFADTKESLDPATAETVLSVLKNLGASQGAVLYTFEIYLGPKDIDRLGECEVGLEDSIDFWIVGIISKPMLHLLRWFYSLIPSWAFAIIMLTVLVKLALLYWTQKSFTQMQRMAQLKPMMEELKEKYGRDKERLNQEMMSLYKREKVNPLGGCLPMLLQMPIWIALYRAIYSSVSLFQAPLGGWIQDLSAPDPYFILPIILGGSMFFQQRLSPTTMDNAQAKMMMYMMPVMFTVFMLFLPSGLNLYILVNTFLTMAQQYHLRRKYKTNDPKSDPPKKSSGKRKLRAGKKTA